MAKQKEVWKYLLKKVPGTLNYTDDMTMDIDQETTESGWIRVLEAYYAEHGPYSERKTRSCQRNNPPS